MAQSAMAMPKSAFRQHLLAAMYIQTCLQARGWKLAPANTSFAAWLENNIPDLYWQGNKANEPSLEQFAVYAQICLEEFMNANSGFKAVNASDFNFVMDYEVACMNKRGYGRRRLVND